MTGTPKITLLGTGNAAVTRCYNTCFIIEDEGRPLMVDGGGGNQIFRQLELAGYDWKDMRDIIVTHKHIDHLLGIVWMIRYICQGMTRGGYEGEARLYAHEEVIRLLTQMSKDLLGGMAKKIGEQFFFIEVHDGETLSIAGREVTFFDIQSTKAKQYGFTMRLSNGKKLTCCGDEPYAPCEEEYVKGSEWLLHESFCLYSERDRFNPYKKSHSTVKDACELAEKMAIPNLIIYHTEDKNIDRRKELYTAEGKEYYHGNLFIPDDLEVIEL